MVSIREATWAAAGTESQKALVLEPGDLVLVRSGMLQVSGSRGVFWVDANHFLAAKRRQLCEPAGDHVSCTIVHFEPSVIDAQARADATAALSTPALFLRHWHVLCWSRARPGQRSLIERGALGLLRELGNGPGAQQLTPRANHASLVATVKTKLNGNGAVPVDLGELATLFGMSPFTVSRTFHREVGISIRHYGKRLRLRKAVRLMLETDADLCAIAIDLGFFDQAHFSNAFRQEFGIPPSLLVAAHRHSAQQYATLSVVDNRVAAPAGIER